MQKILDLEIHSRFARAVSKDMRLEVMEEWGEKKGSEIVGTGDCTHPEWFREIKAELEEAEPGLFRRRGSTSSVRFMLTSEISCIFSRAGAVRRIHVLVFAPSFAAAEKINTRLSWIGNLRADGRPMLGLDAKELVKIAIAADPDCLIIPAHVWTPWFGMYGSKSGFNSIKDCFEEQLKYVPAVETGLSSDPPMNWRLSELDGHSIVSFSDAHSAPNIGREATVVELSELSYKNIAAAFRVPFPTATDPNRIVKTIEFFPEEGMYHWDGHRTCNTRWSPEETKKAEGKCPVCGKPVTVGVMSRVEELADRPTDYVDKRRPPFQRLVPLAEIIGDAIGVGKHSKSVAAEYDTIIKAIGSEFTALLDTPIADLAGLGNSKIAEGIERVRNGKLSIVPGYDGVYGTVKVFSEEEQKAGAGAGQKSLF